MKISGNKKNGRYAAGNKRYQEQSSNNYQTTQPNRYPAQQSDQREQFVGPRQARAAAKKKKSKRAGKILIIFLVIIIALAAVLYCVVKLGVKPPPQKPMVPKDGSNTAASDTSGTEPGSASGERNNDSTWTFVIIGFDDGNGNTDTIMVANFDALNHTLNVVNIPRDTLVNVSWNVKKANTLYSSGGKMEGVEAGIEDILGFPVDFYVKVDLQAFIELVDAVDGVDFEVPRDMDYDDPAQNLSIHFTAGMQHLTGQEAMEVVRYRKGYPDADIGRIGTQQDFLLAAAEQVLAKQDKLDITELANVFLKYVDTDLNLGNLIWLGKEFYKTDASNITFTTLPANYGDSVNKISYVTINVDEWLKVLNEKINPYKRDMTAEDLSILTRAADGSLYVTDGVWAGKKSWGSGSTSSQSSGSDSEPVESSEPSEEPSPSPSPSPSESADVSPSDEPSPSPSGEDSTPDVSPTDQVDETSPSPSPDGEVSPSPSSP